MCNVFVTAATIMLVAPEMLLNPYLNEPVPPADPENMNFMDAPFLPHAASLPSWLHSDERFQWFLRWSYYTRNIKEGERIIAGQVRTASHLGINGVVLSGLPGPPVTDAVGFYLCLVTNGWSGTVVPAKADYTFSPPRRTYTNLVSNQLAQNYLPNTFWFVSPNAATNGDGSIGNPWRLQAAFNSSNIVQPGDTVWLRGGTYQASGDQRWAPHFSGLPAKLITWRNYSNETVKIDGHWRFDKNNYHRFWGLELYDSQKGTYTNTPPVLHVDDASPPLGNEWVNCVVHDVHNMWSGSTAGASVRGCIVWYAGREVREHGIYGGLGAFSGNIVGWTSGYAVNSPSGLVTSNVLYGSGYTISNSTTEIITEAEGMVIRRNLIYSPYLTGGGIKCGYSNSTNQTLTVQDNVMAGPGPLITYGSFDLFTCTGNTIHSNTNVDTVVSIKEAITAWTWNNNRYSKQGGSVAFEDDNVMRTFASWVSAHPGLDAASTAQDNATPADAVYVYPNQDEPKRAHVAVFNWTLKPNVQVNLAGVLSAGDTYEVRNAQDYLGQPVATGVYTGAPPAAPRHQPLSGAGALWQGHDPARLDRPGICRFRRARQEWNSVCQLGSRNSPIHEGSKFRDKSSQQYGASPDDHPARIL